MHKEENRLQPRKIRRGGRVPAHAPRLASPHIALSLFARIFLTKLSSDDCHSGKGASPIFSDSRHRRRELRGRVAGRLSDSILTSWTLASSSPASLSDARANSAKLAPLPPPTT